MVQWAISSGEPE